MSLVVVVVLAASFTEGAAAAPDATSVRQPLVSRAIRHEPLHVYPAVTAAIRSTGWADVLVGLRPAVADTAPLSVLRDATSSTQDLVLRQWIAAGAPAK